MSDDELRDAAVKALRSTTIDYTQWSKNVAAGKYPALGPPSQWGIAFDNLTKIGIPTNIGKILYKIDFSTPSPYGYTWGIQAGNYGTTDTYHQGSLFDAINLDGIKVGRMFVPSKPTGRAAEGLVKRSIDIGATDYFGVSIRVPTGWTKLVQNSGWHTVVTQLNYGSLGGPPVSIAAGQTSLEVMVLSGHVSSVNGGEATDYEFQANPNKGQRLFLTESLQENVWYDIIVEVLWKTDWTGHINSWLKESGVWKLKVAIDKIPTQQYGFVEGHNVTADGTDISTAKPYVTTDKSGIYAGPGPDYTVYHRKWARGTSFNAIAAELA